MARTSGLRPASSIHPGHPGPVYTGFTAWRLLTAPDTAKKLGAEHSAETWGPGGVVGVMRLADDAVYSYATAVVPPGGGAADVRAELLRRVYGWHDPIPAVVAAAEPESVLRNDVWHMPAPLPTLHRGRVALAGDAAHPMAPTLGQGACQAVEDAVTLAHAVRRGAEEVPATLAGYTAARLPRTASIVRNSARVGRMVHSRSALVRSLRDGGLGLIGRIAPTLFYGSMDQTYAWTPPGED